MTPMLTSDDRMLTTHAGSLPRPPELEALLVRRERGEAFDRGAFEQAVADRICLYAEAIGDARRVIAGTDCGVGTFASYRFVADDAVWAKLRMLADGAQLATERL